MAKIKGIKVPKKAVRRDPMFMDEQYTGEEPKWDHDRAVEFSDEVFDHHLRKSFNYYNYYFSSKDMKKYVQKWLMEHTKFTKEQIAVYMGTADSLTPMPLCCLVKATTMGMPLREKHRNYILDNVTRLIREADPTVLAPPAKETKKRGKKVEEPAPAPVKEEPKAKAPTIQDRLNEKAREIIGDIEGIVDDVYRGKKVTVKIYDMITARNLPQAKIGMVRDVFQKQVNELTEAFTGKDKQLQEGYSHLTKADVKRIGEFYVQLMAELDAYTQVKKATKKVRAKRPVDKAKVVSKMKYMKESKELRIVSVPPAEILTASEVWVFNTKTRKLFRYVAEMDGTLGVKGTSIIGFDDIKSVGKTLRNPPEQLKALLKAGKVQLRTFLKDIKAVEVKGTGRLNEECLLLRVA